MLYATSEDWVESQKLIDRDLPGTTTAMASDGFRRSCQRAWRDGPGDHEACGSPDIPSRSTSSRWPKTDDYQVRFVKLTESFAHTDISQLLWIRISVEQIMKSYSSIASRDKVTIDDFKRFIDDFQDFGFTLHLIDNSIPTAYADRFREADIFTPSSNGDSFMDMNEATYYIAYFYSGKVLSMKLLTNLAQNCVSQGLDPLLYNWVPASCFRLQFYGNYRQWWDHFPDLIKFYESLSASQQLDFQKALEKGSRRCGYSEHLFHGKLRFRCRYRVDPLHGRHVRPLRSQRRPDPRS